MEASLPGGAAPRAPGSADHISCIVDQEGTDLVWCAQSCGMAGTGGSVCVYRGDTHEVEGDVSGAASVERGVMDRRAFSCSIFSNKKLINLRRDEDAT